MISTKTCVYVELEGRIHIIPLKKDIDFDLLSTMLFLFKPEDQERLTAVKLSEEFKFEALGGNLQ